MRQTDSANQAKMHNLEEKTKMESKSQIPLR